MESDPENVRLRARNVELNGWGGQVEVLPVSVDDDQGRLLGVDRQVRLAKIDVEGAERDAVRMLWPSIEAGMVDHLLVEVSPVFDDYSPHPVSDLVERKSVV